MKNLDINTWNFSLGSGFNTREGIFFLISSSKFLLYSSKKEKEKEKLECARVKQEIKRES